MSKSMISRRQWIRHSAMTMAGVMFAPHVFSHVRPDKTVRLYANENPYGPGPLARKAMADALADSNRYAFDVSLLLREKIAFSFGLTAEHVLPGSGSSEILGLVANYAGKGPGNIVTAEPSFNWWLKLAEASGLQIRRVPLDRDKRSDLKAIRAAITTDTKLVYLCNPNNPTGTLHASELLREYVQEISRSTTVLIDEAYLDFTTEPSLAPLVAENRNVIIARTFSKLHGLAGARVGYALAHPETIQLLAALQPWPHGSVSVMAMRAAIASLEDKAFIEDARGKNAAARAYTGKRLQAMNIPYIESSANFIYFSVDRLKGRYTNLFKERNILVGREAEDNGTWTRITIGTMDEMRIFCQLLQEFYHT